MAGLCSLFPGRVSAQTKQQRLSAFYQDSTLHFVKVEPELLNLKQQQERLHLMGRAWWFLKDFTRAEEAWSQYLKNSKSIKPEQALNLKYQLATGFQQEKNYKKAERWVASSLT